MDRRMGFLNRFAYQVLALLLLPLIGIGLNAVAADSNFTDCYWSLTMNVNIPGGEEVGAKTIAECQTACLSKPGCMSIDWDSSATLRKQCHLSQKQIDKTATSVTNKNSAHYDLICRTCYWTHVVNGFVMIGTRSNSFTLADCQAACLSNPACCSVDWLPGYGGYMCALILTKNPKITAPPISGGINHYDLSCTTIRSPNTGLYNSKSGSWHYVSKDAATYEVAQQKCRSMSAKLASLYSLQDMAFYGRTMAASRDNCSKADDCSRYWVNLQDMFQDQYGDYAMYDSEPSVTNFSNICGFTYRIGDSDRADWDIGNCRRPMRYICSKAIQCPEGFITDITTEFCYQLIPTRTTWSRARSACQDIIHGSRLAVFVDFWGLFEGVNQVNTAFKDVVSACYAGDYHKNSYWVGAQTKDPKNCSTPIVWKPSNTATLPITYDYWMLSQPDCGGGVENCVHLSGGFSYMMNDEICEKFLACPLCQLRWERLQ